MRRLGAAVLVAGALLFAACSRSFEPGLYRVRGESVDGFLRVGTDSLGNETALFYADSARLVADTAWVSLKKERGKMLMLFRDGREEKIAMSPYEAPFFRRFTSPDLYLLPMFEVGETKNVAYGRVHNAPGGGDGNLLMDLYYPLRDSMDARPLLVTFHGGGFVGGDKRDTLLVEWNRHFASLGYVVASVNYRIAAHKVPGETEEAMFYAVRDANAAVRFLLKRDSLRVNSKRIFAAGNDAGAVTALNLAYFDEESFPDSLASRQFLRGYGIRAVANLWGAVPDTSLLYNAAVPVISFQDRNDPVIPFGAGYPYEEEENEDLNVFQSILEAIISIFVPETHAYRKVYGAGEIDRILRQCGVSSELHATDGERHDLVLSDDGKVDYPLFDEIKDRTARFFAGRMETSPVSLRRDPEDPQLLVIDKSEVGVCLWHVEGGAVIGKSDDTIRVLLFPDEPVHSVTVSGFYTSGLAFYETVTL